MSSDSLIAIKITPSLKGGPKHDKIDPRAFFTGATIIPNVIVTQDERDKNG